mmetsp:Transcript_23466/g.32746  ORF Transcript_23466/g.32746 Transcript_23466/m.32746 type:complete len:83 (+) Transcript_23466:123-371(+)
MHMRQVMESAGTFSFVKIGDEKRWIYAILDDMFLEKAKAKDKPLWECIGRSDSEWFRVPKQLSYPLKMQNMRYFYRLYRRKR